MRFRKSEIQDQEIRESKGAGLQTWRLYSIQAFSAKGQNYSEKAVQRHPDETTGRSANRALETSSDRANRKLHDSA